MDSDSARVLDKDGIGVTSTDLGAGKRGLDVNASVSLDGATVEVGEVDQGAAGIDPWAVEFLTPQHVVVDSGGAVGLTDAELRATPVPISGAVTTDVDTSLLALESGGVLDDILTELGAKTEPADTQITKGPADLVTGPDVLSANSGPIAITALSGFYGVSVTIVTTSLSATVGFGTSYDGGTTYQASYVFNAAGQLVASLVSPGSLTASYTYPVTGGASHVSLNLSSYVSGSVSVTFRKTAAMGMGLPTSGLNSGSTLTTSTQIGGQWLDVLNLLTPIGIRTFGTVAVGDPGVIVKPINAATYPLFVKDVRAATPTVAQVADSATSVTLLASGSTRLGATIYNDSSAVLRVKLGATASATSFSVLLQGNGSGVGGYYEVPGNYTGIIDGIWASAPGGFAYVTSLVI